VTHYRQILLAILFSASVIPIPQAAESSPKPEMIVADYLRAMGGAQRIAGIRTQTITGNLLEVSTGKNGSYSLIAKAPNRFYIENLIEPDQEVAAYNGMSAWEQSPAEGLRTLIGDASRKAEAWGRYLNGRLVDAKKDKLTLQWMGIESVNGMDAYHIRVVLGPKLARDTFFGKASHLIVRESSGEEQFDYDDYRAVNGIQTPYKIELRRAGRAYRISVTRAEYNAPVDDSVFAFPHKGSAPLPEISALLSQVNKNQKALEEIRKDYTCHLTTEEEESDPDGKTKTTSEFEVFHVAGEEVRRLLVKDGKPLGDKEQKKEQERFNKEFDKLKKRQAELDADPKKQKQEEEKDEVLLSKLLQAWRFSNARREKFRGHDVIAVDFGPNPAFKAKGLQESFAHSLAGVMWIDEQALQITRIEARFTDSVKIAGGILAALEKGSNVVWEQAKVNDEVWLPVYTEIHVGGRMLFFKAKANEIDRYSDYKKFRVDSKILGVDQN
jgi:hypothetical protein